MNANKTKANVNKTNDTCASCNANLKGTTDTATTTNHKDLSNTAAQDGCAAASEDGAQCLVGGTGEMFVPEPMGEDITTDPINGLHGFKDAVRWKVHFKLLQEEKDKENQSNGNIANNTQEEQEQQPHNPGLKTNLKPIKINLSAPRADDETERFLLQLEEELLKQALDKIEAKGRNNKSHKIKSLQQKLRNHDNLAAVPTN